MAQPIVVSAGNAQQASPALSAFCTGDAVKVRRFGRGTVVASDGSSVTVGFDDGSERCFHPDYVTALRRSVARAAAVRKPLPACAQAA